MINNFKKKREDNSTMASLSGTVVGKLVISSDVVAKADDVRRYVEDTANGLLTKIDAIAVDGFVPLSALSSEVLKIISSNYQTVVDYLDGKQDDQIIVGGGGSTK